MLTLWPRRWRKKPAQQHIEEWPLDAELLSWAAGCPCSIGQSLENMLIMGGTGSGKTSACGRKIATSMLKAGFGGLILTAKADEIDLWKAYCSETGRLADLCIVEPGGQYRYNVLDSELAHADSGIATYNIVSLLSTVMEKAQQGSQSGGGGNDNKFWEDGARQLLTNAVDLLLMATGKVSIPALHRLIMSAPDSLETARSAQWKANSELFRLLSDADPIEKSPSRFEDFKLVADYWLFQYPGLNSRTRSIFTMIVSTMLATLNRGVARDLLSADTTINPADAAAGGKIVLVALPVLEYREAGVLCQALVKTAFQRSILRRNVRTSPRPVFLWSDEFQATCTSMDSEFLAVCRSARVSCVFLTQNLGAVRATLGGGNVGEARADALFGNLNTKLFLSNGCPVTCQWASSLVGTSLRPMATGNTQIPADWVSAAIGIPAQNGTSAGFNESYQLNVQPSEFQTLRTGGAVNGWAADAIIVQSGRVFRDTGTTWRRARFLQRP